MVCYFILLVFQINKNSVFLIKKAKQKSLKTFKKIIEK